MISDETRDAICAMRTKGMKIRQIARTLGLSRNTVRTVLKGTRPEKRSLGTSYENELPLIHEAFHKCRGNVVRVQEVLAEKGIGIGYSTLTRIARDQGLREPERPRAGIYTFGPGEEMQHDTSPHKVILDGKPVIAQCAALILAYSRKIFIRYYPCFTRFEAKVFLSEGFTFMDGVTDRVVIDNTSVIVAGGSGRDAEMAPEMEAFGRIFGITFVAHRIGHANRKGRIERPFFYVERNFLAGRSFLDWHDLNDQALAWCCDRANKKLKRSLGMSPDEAYVMEKPHLRALPVYLPPIYDTVHRVVDVEGYVNLDTNRYSVPERLVGKKVEVQKHSDKVIVLFDHTQVASHPRIIGKRDTRVTSPGHHGPLHRDRVYRGPSAEEQALLGESEILDRYVGEIKKRSAGRGVARLRRLLNLKQTYPAEPFLAALTKALTYGLYDLSRLEKMIIENVAGDFFRFSDEYD
ncbi:MAG: IS21/IS408/IS1162 family transposase [Candidatus Micrarchaeota archaeon]